MVAAIVIAVVVIALAFGVQRQRAVAARRQEVARQVTEIREGHLPTVPAPAGYEPTKGEVVHAHAKASGVRSDDDRQLGDGLLVVSSRRLCFLGKRKTSMPWSKIENAGAGGRRAIVVYMKDGKGFEFTLASVEDADLIGELLAERDAS